MDLNPKELYALEIQMFRNKQIQEEEFLYYDEDRNIRIGIIQRDNTDDLDTTENQKLIHSLDQLDTSL